MLLLETRAFPRHTHLGIPLIPAPEPLPQPPLTSQAGSARTHSMNSPNSVSSSSLASHWETPGVALALPGSACSAWLCLALQAQPEQTLCVVWKGGKGMRLWGCRSLAGQEPQQLSLTLERGRTGSSLAPVCSSIWLGTASACSLLCSTSTGTARPQWEASQYLKKIMLLAFSLCCPANVPMKYRPNYLPTFRLL